MRENKGIVRPGSTEDLGEGNPGAAEVMAIPDYVMLDFTDDFLPEEAANSRLRKSHMPPELSG